MNSIIPIAILGDGPHARALKDHAAPIGRFAIRPDWRDADVSVLLALGVPGTQRDDIAAALRAGRVVLTSPSADLPHVDGGKLIVAGEIAYSEAGSRAIELIRAPEFGPLRSLYMAIRQSRAQSGDLLEDIGWEALNFVLAVAKPKRVHATAGAVFGGRARDTAVIIMRTENDAVITIELSRCLPPTLPAPGLGEVEIEALGANQSIHVEPHATSVRTYRETSINAAPWLDAPILRMLRTVAAVVDGAPPPPQRDPSATMTAIRGSVGAAEPMPV
jgi:predicted dehydrogenase